MVKFIQSRRPNLISVAVTVALTLPGATWAADAPDDQTGPAPTASAAQAEAMSEVIVTGSRIALSPGMFTPTPVTAVTQDELAKMAPTSLIDSLSTLPEFFGNSIGTGGSGGQAPGGAEVNLRGANTSSGISRTLVLLDGRRTTPNSRFGAVDISSFPDDLIKAVDVVTGGASASYGSDAVAGVVNFILDDKFEGVKLSGQGGITARGDGPTDKFAITVGKAFLGGKLHIVGSYSVFDQTKIDGIQSLESRPWYNDASRVTTGVAGAPTYTIANNVIPTNFSYTGTITGIPAINGYTFSPDGKTIAPLQPGTLGKVGDACNCEAFPYNLNTQGQSLGVDNMDEVQGGYWRHNGFLHATYDITDSVQGFVQGMYGKDDSNGRWQSAAPLESWAVPVGLDNPYLSAQERTVIGNALATNFPNTTGALAGSAPGTRFVYPGNDALATQYFTDNVFLNNQPGNPLGETRQITINNTYQGTAGFAAKLLGWNIDGYGQKGETHQDYIDTNGTRTDRLFFAMDAVADPVSGQAVCRAASQSYDPLYYKSFADCAPINMFGGWSNISPAAAAYVSGPTKHAHQIYGLTNGELNANGTIFSGIGAGDWKMAVGISYRKESIFQTTPDPTNEYPAFLNGTLVSSVIPTQPSIFRGVIPQGFAIGRYGYTAPWPATSPTVPVNGVQTGGIPGLYYVPTGFLGDASSSTIEFSSERTFAGDSVVREGFTEFNLPLLKDKFLINSLSADLAYREADYSGSGTIPAWKVGGDWAINDTIRLRATRSRDVRAASLEERFDQTRGGVTVQNPYVLTNGAPTTQSGAGFSGGNPNLKPEKADTWTAGFVVTPTFLPNFSTSVDWYDISISDAIDKPTTQQIINAAFAGDPTYQALVKLDASNNVVEVDQYYINFAQAFVEGVDVESSYHQTASLLKMVGFGDAPEDTSVRVYFTDTIKNATLTSFGTYEEYAGQVGTGRSIPKQKYTVNWNYDKGPYSLFVQGRYLSHGILDNTLIQSSAAIPGALVLNNQAAAGTINNNTIGGMFYMDLNLAYQIPVSGGDFRAFVEVQNALDRYPPTVAGAIGRTGDTETNPLLYDVLGRRYTVGVTFRWR